MDHGDAVYGGSDMTIVQNSREYKSMCAYGEERSHSMLIRFGWVAIGPRWICCVFPRFRPVLFFATVKKRDDGKYMSPI